MFRGRLWQVGQDVGVAVRDSFAVLERLIEPGEELERPAIWFLTLPMLSSALWSENMRDLVPQRYPRRRLRAQMMVLASQMASF